MIQHNNPPYVSSKRDYFENQKKVIIMRIPINDYVGQMWQNPHVRFLGEFWGEILCFYECSE